MINPSAERPFQPGEILNGWMRPWSQFEKLYMHLPLWQEGELLRMCGLSPEYAPASGLFFQPRSRSHLRPFLSEFYCHYPRIIPSCNQRLNDYGAAPFMGPKGASTSTLWTSMFIAENAVLPSAARTFLGAGGTCYMKIIVTYKGSSMRVKTWLTGERIDSPGNGIICQGKFSGRKSSFYGNPKNSCIRLYTYRRYRLYLNIQAVFGDQVLNLPFLFGGDGIQLVE